VRERWLGATGTRVPEIAVEGEDVVIADDSHISIGGRSIPALVLDEVGDAAALARAHAAGTPVVVRAGSADAVRAALARPEVACAVVPPSERNLRELDLPRLTYG
jgi:hypothetical protein